MTKQKISSAVVDTSALVSIILDEPSAAAFKDAMSRCESLVMSEGTLAEVSIVVMSSKGKASLPVLDTLLDGLGIEIIGREGDPKIFSHSEVLRAGYFSYGKNWATDKKRALNFGDMFSYALAKELEVPLFFQGIDFSTTDVPCAMNLLGYPKDKFGVPSMPVAAKTK
jgi:ribonuclease VapC